MEEIEKSELERDIEKYPEFMANFYDRKLTGTENLTMTDKLEADRVQWQQNKEKAEKLSGR